MAKKQKVKGVRWERDAVDLLKEAFPDGKFKRVAGSGAIGTIMDEPLLAGDIMAVFPHLSREFRAEAKVGYGGATQMALKREWFEKIKKEAKGTYSLPMLMGKFSGARGDCKYFVAFDFETFVELMNYFIELSESEADLTWKMEELKK
jgi:hypothetical protein